MKKSTVWLIVGIGAVVMFMIVGCCTVSAIVGKKSGNTTAVAKSDIDLEKLTKAFETYVSGGAKDINGFEKVVNDKSKGIYKGKDTVKVTMDNKGAVMGYVDKDNAPGYTKGKDEVVFTMQAEKDKKRVVAYDRHRNYYGHRSSSSGFFTGLLIGNMLTRQRGYYGYYWRPPASARWRTTGYYNRMRSSYGRSRSYRSGYRSSRSGSYRSSGYRSGYRSGSRSGGFSFGKN